MTPLPPPFETAIVHSFNDYIRGDGAEDQIPKNQNVGQYRQASPLVDLWASATVVAAETHEKTASYMSAVISYRVI